MAGKGKSADVNHTTMKSVHLLVLGALTAASSAHAALLLQPPSMGMGQESVYWEYYSGTGDNRSLSSGNAAGTPAAGVGTIAPVSPGYRASTGYYSFMGSFGLTATTTVTSLSDIQNVVFQRVSIANPDFSVSVNLNWDGTEITANTVDDPSMGAAPSITQGGPWLSYYDAAENLLGRVQATVTGILASSADISVGSFSGDLYSFSYQWDLSSVTEEVKSIRIDAPIMAHSSTVEARIDIGGSYVQVVPEPSTGLLSLGMAALLIRRRR